MVWITLKSNFNGDFCFYSILWTQCILWGQDDIQAEAGTSVIFDECDILSSIVDSPQLVKLVERYGIVWLSPSI